MRSFSVNDIDASGMQGMRSQTFDLLTPQPFGRDRTFRLLTTFRPMRWFSVNFMDTSGREGNEPDGRLVDSAVVWL